MHGSNLSCVSQYLCPFDFLRGPKTYRHPNHSAHLQQYPSGEQRHSLPMVSLLTSGPASRVAGVSSCCASSTTSSLPVGWLPFSRGGSGEMEKRRATGMDRNPQPQTPRFRVRRDAAHGFRSIGNASSGCQTETLPASVSLRT